jgi:hypothetical protein
VLDQLINVTDKWWLNVGRKEGLSITLTAGAPGPGAPTIVCILSMRKLCHFFILTLRSLSSLCRYSTMDLRRKGERILNPFWISVGSYSVTTSIRCTSLKSLLLIECVANLTKEIPYEEVNGLQVTMTFLYLIW